MLGKLNKDGYLSLQCQQQTFRQCGTEKKFVKCPGLTLVRPTDALQVQAIPVRLFNSSVTIESFYITEFDGLLPWYTSECASLQIYTKTHMLQTCEMMDFIY